VVAPEVDADARTTDFAGFVIGGHDAELGTGCIRNRCTGCIEAAEVVVVTIVFQHLLVGEPLLVQHLLLPDFIEFSFGRLGLVVGCCLFGDWIRFHLGFFGGHDISRLNLHGAGCCHGLNYYRTLN